MFTEYVYFKTVDHFYSTSVNHFYSPIVSSNLSKDNSYIFDHNTLNPKQTKEKRRIPFSALWFPVQTREKKEERNFFLVR